MTMVSLTLKVPEKMVKVLKGISHDSQVPQSALIRRGIELVILERQEDVITPEIKGMVDDLIREDRKLLERLAEA